MLRNWRHQSPATQAMNLITLPVKTVERLIDIAAGARGVGDAPTLMMFSDVRPQIERSR